MITLEKKERTDNENQSKKTNNFTIRNKEKSNIAIKKKIDNTKIISFLFLMIFKYIFWYFITNLVCGDSLYLISCKCVNTLKLNQILEI